MLVEKYVMDGAQSVAMHFLPLWICIGMFGAFITIIAIVLRCVRRPEVREDEETTSPALESYHGHHHHYTNYGTLTFGDGR